MNKRNLILVLIVFLSVVLGLLLGNLLARRAEIRGPQGDFSFLSREFSNNKLDEVLSLIDQQYVDSIDVNELTEEMMVDLIAKLDPHSVYIPAADLENVNSELEGVSVHCVQAISRTYYHHSFVYQRRANRKIGFTRRVVLWRLTLLHYSKKVPR
jgi:hypothetical protein